MVVKHMTNLNDPKQVVNMLIVDDEPIICEGLKLTINWDQIHVNVIGEAYDGEEALDIIREHDVDLVLSDIRMDGMDGLQLAERLKKEFPHIRMILISGYEDFEYARRALRAGVKDYLLKPVEIDDLLQVVQKVAKGIREEKEIDEEVLWLSGMIRDPEKYERAAPPQLAGFSYRVIVSQWKDFARCFASLPEGEYRKIQNRWVRLIHDRFISAFGIRSVSAFEHKNLLFTLALCDQELDDNQWRRMLDKVMQGWKGSGSLCFAVSPAFRQLEQTGLQGKKALELLPYHLHADSPVLFLEDCDKIKQEVEKPEFNYKELVQSMVSVLFKHDLEEMAASIKALFQTFREHRLLLHEVLEIYDELFVLLRHRLRQSGFTEMESSCITAIDLNIYNSYDSVEALAVNEMEQLMRLIEHSGVDKSYWIIEKAKAYVAENDHYDIKAAEVAEWLKITPSYFSMLFKQSTGKNFKEYMNEMRMERAKHLLATTHDKVFEIANKVGYKEYKYFVSVFKSYTGMTPMEYRSLAVKSMEHSPVSG